MLSLAIFLRQKKYFATAFFFSCFSLIFSTWATYIPYIAERLGITEGRIGGAIFFTSVGSFIMIPGSNWLVDKLGVGRMSFWAVCFYSIAGLLPMMAATYTQLCIAQFIFGMGGCMMAISINSLTATVEKADNAYIMTGSHGFFSIGGMVGALTGSFIAATLHSPLIHMAFLGAILISIQFYLRDQYYHITGEHVSKEKRSIHTIKPLIIIAIVGLIFMVSEGAIADWSALYMKKIVKINLAFIGFGYAGFSAAMATGRFFGDWVSRKLGSWQLIITGTTLSLFGFMLVLVPMAPTSMVGFTIIGLGFSAIVPEIFRLASKIEGIKTNDGVAVIAATTNVGFMVGPVLLGFLAELHTLHFSFLVLSCFVAVALIIAVGNHFVFRK
ncbi:MAG TPA: MFS transporter [Bacteroidales bacterium]|nr:MFS transporter [Bacteroidales bacterium]